MALGNETLPLGGDDENNWEARNAATPFIDMTPDEAASASVAGAGQSQFDSTVTPEMMQQLGGQPTADNGAQLGTAPPAPDVATPQAAPAPVAQDGGATPPGGPQEAPPENAVPPQAPVAAAPPPAALQPLGPPPPPPALTGDPTKDVQQNLLYHRQLTDYQALAAQHAQALDQHKAAVESKRADRELEIEQNAATIRNDTVAKQNEETAHRQKAVDDAVTERTTAYKDLSEGNGFLDQSLGDEVLGAIIFAMGDRQSTLRNVAAAQLGQASNFQNEGLKTIQGIMERRYQQKAARLKAASDGVLEARYGYKDAAENHRAALNDLDADVAANYRLAAKEAEQQLRSRGADAATVTGNAVVAGLYQAGADAEGKIHEREEELGVKRQAATAQQAAAAAHFDQGERQIEATQEHNKGTLALGWAGERDRHEDRRAALAAKKAADAEKDEAKKAKAAEDLDKRTLRDPDTGDEIVVLSRPGAVDKAAEKLTASRAYSKGLRELADDAEKNHRVAPALPLIGNVTEASKRRDELYGNVIARGRKALDLGVSNANIQIEHGNVGGSGKGLSSMPSPTVLRRMADENDTFANERLRSSGKAVNGALPPEAKTGGAPANGRPPATSVPADVISQSWRALEDPHATPKQKQKATSALAAAGQL